MLSVYLISEATAQPLSRAQGNAVQTANNTPETNAAQSANLGGVPGANNYRTHKINKIELSPVSNADAAPAAAASDTKTAPLEGTSNPLVDTTITPPEEFVNCPVWYEWTTGGMKSIYGHHIKSRDHLFANIAPCFPVPPSRRQVYIDRVGKMNRARGEYILRRPLNPPPVFPLPLRGSG